MKKLGTYVSVCAVVALTGWLASGCAQTNGSAGQHESNTNIVKFTGANFQQQVLASSKPVVVDFWAPWCGPCRALAPTISDLADEYKDRVVVGKVNVDDEVGLSEKYNIEGIPAVFIFKDGKPVHQLIGLREKKEYQELLNQLVTAAPGQSAAR